MGHFHDQIRVLYRPSPYLPARTGERPESVVDLGLAQFGGVLDPFSAESTAATEPDCVHGRGLDDCSMTMEVVKTEANGVVQGPKPLRFLERRGCRLMVCRTNARFGRLRNHKRLGRGTWRLASAGSYPVLTLALKGTGKRSFLCWI